MKVKEFMTTRIETIEIDKSVYDAVERMVDKKIRSLLVRFSGKDQENGIITARDVVFKVLAKGLDPKKVKVSQIASKPIISIDQNTECLGVTEVNSVSARGDKYGFSLVGSGRLLARAVGLRHGVCSGRADNQRVASVVVRIRRTSSGSNDYTFNTRLIEIVKSVMI